MTKTETAKRLLKRVFVKKNHLDGYHEEYYEIDDKLDGEYKSWYKNGQLHVHDHFKNDKSDGECKNWDRNGQLRIHCYYKNNKLDGEYKEWYENGQLREHCYYKDGMKIN